MPHLALKKYSIPWSKNGQNPFWSTAREGLLAFVSLGGETYCGEYAPLQGIHSHTVNDVVGMARSIDIAPDFLQSDQKYNFPYPLSYLLSMVHAHYSLLASSHDQDIKQAILLSALVDEAEPGMAIKQAQGFLSQGYGCLKIKVGRDIVSEADKINAIATFLPKDTLLRLDANKKLSLAEACGLMKSLRGMPVQYFEEPAQNFSDALKLHEEYGVPIAIDESFSAPFSMHNLLSSAAHYFIIKPSRFSSIYDAIALAKTAQDHGITPIFSTAFESDFTAAIMALLVVRAGLHEHAHGIFIEGMFNQSPWSIALPALGGRIGYAEALSFIKAIGKGMNGHDEVFAL